MQPDEAEAETMAVVVMWSHWPHITSQHVLLSPCGRVSGRGLLHCNRDAQTLVYQLSMAHILIFFKSPKNVTAHFPPRQMKDKCGPSNMAVDLCLWTTSEQGHVLWCWERLGAITSPFTTCAKVVRRGNEVSASNDSLEHCSISYVKQAGPGYWL